MTITSNSPDMWVLAGSAFMSFVTGVYNSFKSNKIDKNVPSGAIKTLNDVVGAVGQKMDDLTEQSRSTTIKEFSERLDRIEQTQEKIIDALKELKHERTDVSSEQSGKN